MVTLNWSYKDIDVSYSPELDGDGTSMATQFVDYLRANHGNELPFDCAFEWCAGPGFIGFALLADGLCEQLVLADINAEACDAARSTVEANGLSNRVRVYTSDNLAQIPADERFDLVVSNPPNYYCLNPRHPWYAELAGDLRPNDPGWALHRAFYAGISAYLKPNALLVIEEVDPFAEKCFLPNELPHLPLWGPEPFDIRPRPPVDDFCDMIEAAGLSYLRTVAMPHPSVPVHLMISRNDPDNRQVRLRERITVYEQVGADAAGNYQIIASDGDRLHGTLSVDEDRLWVVDLLEMLGVAGGAGKTPAELATGLEMQESDLQPLLVHLRRLGWIHAPGIRVS